jgi:uncharacterized OB-fold protein
MSELPTEHTVALVAPVPDELTQPWWDACRELRLLVRRCASCGRASFPPRPMCPHCWSDDVSWEETDGTGTLYSFAVVHENDLPAFRDSVPYVAAVVELTAGVRMMTTIVSTPFDALAVDAPVEVVFAERGERTFPVFRVRR